MGIPGFFMVLFGGTSAAGAVVGADGGAGDLSATPAGVVVAGVPGLNVSSGTAVGTSAGDGVWLGASVGTVVWSGVGVGASVGITPASVTTIVADACEFSGMPFVSFQLVIV